MNQKPVAKVFPPSRTEQSEPGTGKFVIFTREPVGAQSTWDFTAGAWECIPSQPDTPIKKRVEFCHSSWCATPLLDVLVHDDSNGMYPRFVRLSVDSSGTSFTQNLYDINYRTWDVRCIWQGGRLDAFGIIGDSIFCQSDKEWLDVSAATGDIEKKVSFIPLGVDGKFWLVRKKGETSGCWSYDSAKQQYVSHFGQIDGPMDGYMDSRLSLDGKNRAHVLAPLPRDSWDHGVIKGTLVLQRDGEKDLSLPVEMGAFAGSGMPVIPYCNQLFFSEDGKQLQFRSCKEREAKEDEVWMVDVATGKVHSEAAPHLVRRAVDFQGGPLPDYLRENAKEFSYFGRSGLAPAFLMHEGIIKEKPGYPDCIAGVSRDGRHILFRALKGPLAGFFIYGNLVSRKTVRWPVPAELVDDNSEEFLWVETP